MNFKTLTAIACTAVAVALTAISTNSVTAQTASQAPANTQTGSLQNRLAFGSTSYKRDREIKKLAKTMRTAKTDTDRKAAEKSLRGLLDKEYDERIASYEKYLNELEAQLKEMRTKLQRRRSAKSDMIDLRIKVLAAEADDLGWPAKNRYFPGLQRTKSPFGTARGGR